MDRKCPYCGSALPEGAAFCPRCAQDVHSRAHPPSPVPRRKKVLLCLAALAVLAAGAAGLLYVNRPYVPVEYDGVGEVFYTTGDTTYQLLVAWPDDRCQPAPDIYQNARTEERTRWPSRWYVNYKDTGADAWPEFEALVEQVTVEVVQDEAGVSQLAATQPAHVDYSPDAAMVSYLDFFGGCGQPQVVWTARMKNGDVIRVRQTIHVTPVYTYIYDYHDYPMNTLAELQALLQRLEKETNRMDDVILYLPPVTYEGRLELTGRSFEFHGCTDGEKRTAFTGSVQVTAENSYWITYFYDMDFTGSGDEIGISAAAKSWMVGCSFTGYKTGVLAYGTAWVNLTGCRFTDNQVGFHFNSTGQSASSDYFGENQFTGNGTAVLLENVPTDMPLCFDGSSFSGNGTDIDNRCSHSIDLSNAVFE